MRPQPAVSFARLRAGLSTVAFGALVVLTASFAVPSAASAEQTPTPTTSESTPAPDETGTAPDETPSPEPSDPTPESTSEPTAEPTPVAEPSPEPTPTPMPTGEPIGSLDLNERVMAGLAGFEAGRIIDDGVFYRSGTMTEAQIQAFLNSKVKSCEPGYTCLKDYRQTTANRPADAMCKGYQGAANELASRILYKVSQSCGINPQVLLVMLQKEQGLVTHTWPSAWRFDAALGQDCPDTPAGCSDAYKGFFSQMYGGSWQMKRYTNPPGTSQFFTWIPVGDSSSILYNPSTSCGSSRVLIRNQATASLYYYTPYQPNAAALRAGYGEGDGCSAYGNRNFYNYFTDWFGSTKGDTTPPVPTFPPPRWASTDADGAVYALSGSQVLAYPLNGNSWGTSRVVAAGLNGARLVTAAGDLNGDGHRDLVVVYSDGRVVLRPGDGTGFNRPERALPIQGSTVTQILGAGDFDGDGYPDVIVARSTGTLELWRGTRAGGLSGPRQIGNGWNGMTQLSAGVDVTGDGRPDLMARDAAGVLRVYPANGSGSFAAVRSIGQGWGGFTMIAASPDVTGDGNVDLVARNAAGSIAVYQGNGSGAFDSPVVSGIGWGAFSQIVSTGPPAGDPRTNPGGAGDLTADGLPDVAAVTAAGALYAYAGDGRGGWKPAQRIAEGWQPGDRLVSLGSFTGTDGGDLGRITAGGDLWLYPSGGSPRQIGGGWGAMTAVVGGIDFDGDGAVDMLGRRSDGTLWLYRGDGAGSWAGAKQIGVGWGGFDLLTHAGDFDGDGFGDLLARTPSGDLWLYPSNGSGSWKTPRLVGNGWGSFTAVAAVGDFDGDGAPDVVARRPDGTLLLYRGNGAAGWAGSRSIGVGWSGMRQIG